MPKNTKVKTKSKSKANAKANEKSKRRHGNMKNINNDIKGSKCRSTRLLLNTRLLQQ